jgi:HAD superfamily hydrolase (TIGR01509 family)
MGTAYEAVLFDFDGVLVDSEPVHFECWREVLIPLGIPFEWQYYHDHFIGVSDRRMLEEAVSRATTSVTVEDAWAMFPTKSELFRKRVLDNPPFVPGIQELFQDLKLFQLGVVSSSLRAEVAPVLQLGGLLPHLGVTVFGDEVTRHKPDPEPYRRAAELLGVQRVLVVEDSEAGLASGRAAGFDVLRIPCPQNMVTLVRDHLRL